MAFLTELFWPMHNFISQPISKISTYLRSMKKSLLSLKTKEKNWDLTHSIRWWFGQALNHCALIAKLLGHHYFLFRFSLTRQQVVYGLERVELRSTDLYTECPFRVTEKGRQRPEPQCKGLDLLYRSADGTCNNLKHPVWGSSFMPFLRFLPPDYSDGVQAFRKARNGGDLPNPRLIR